MPKSILINRETRDFQRNEVNALSMVSGNDAIEQRLWIRLGINKGEWFLDPELGVSWHDLLDNRATPEQIRAEVQIELENEEYIESIDYVKVDNLDKDSRKLKLSFSVLLTTGENLASTGEVTI